MMTVPYYAVVGAPIAHSLSPQIHRAFARHCDLPLIYKKIYIHPADFNKTIPQLFSNGLKGANITAPFKQLAYELVDIRTARAELAQSVNTLYVNHVGKLCGDTTDGAGLIIDIKTQHQATLYDKTIMILGAGGATRSLLPALLAENPCKIFLADRHGEKATSLAAQVISLNEIADYPCDILINTIPTTTWVKQYPFSSPLNLHDTWCYDLCYGPAALAFKRFVQDHNAKKITDGKGMLIAQAAESFFIWHGVKPNISHNNFDPIF